MDDLLGNSWPLNGKVKVHEITFTMNNKLKGIFMSPQLAYFQIRS